MGLDICINRKRSIILFSLHSYRLAPCKASLLHRCRRVRITIRRHGLELAVSHRLVSAGARVRRWTICLEELVVNKTLHPRIGVATGWHHERRRHRVDALSTGCLISIVGVLPIVAIPLEGVRPGESRYASILIASLVIVGGGRTAVCIGI